jgi:metal-responsive CopG/Arc/MetJ family transcriptional regulator
MRITLNLPEKLLDDLRAATGEMNRTALIRAALEEQLKRVMRDRLLTLRGKVSLDVDLDNLRGKDLL